MEETDVWSKMLKKHTDYVALNTTCDIIHPEQHKLSKTKISTFSKGLQENPVKPDSAFFDD